MCLLISLSWGIFRALERRKIVWEDEYLWLYLICSFLVFVIIISTVISFKTGLEFTELSDNMHAIIVLIAGVMMFACLFVLTLSFW